MRKRASVSVDVPFEPQLPLLEEISSRAGVLLTERSPLVRRSSDTFQTWQQNLQFNLPPSHCLPGSQIDQCLQKAYDDAIFHRCVDRFLRQCLGKYYENDSDFCVSLRVFRGSLYSAPLRLPVVPRKDSPKNDREYAAYIRTCFHVDRESQSLMVGGRLYDESLVYWQGLVKFAGTSHCYENPERDIPQLLELVNCPKHYLQKAFQTQEQRIVEAYHSGGVYVRLERQTRTGSVGVANVSGLYGLENTCKTIRDHAVGNETRWIPATHLVPGLHASTYATRFPASGIFCVPDSGAIKVALYHKTDMSSIRLPYCASRRPGYRPVGNQTAATSISLDLGLPYKLLDDPTEIELKHWEIILRRKFLKGDHSSKHVLFRHFKYPVTALFDHEIKSALEKYLPKMMALRNKSPFSKEHLNYVQAVLALKKLLRMPENLRLEYAVKGTKMNQKAQKYFGTEKTRHNEALLVIKKLDPVCGIFVNVTYPGTYAQAIGMKPILERLNGVDIPFMIYETRNEDLFEISTDAFLGLEQAQFTLSQVDCSQRDIQEEMKRQIQILTQKFPEWCLHQETLKIQLENYLITEAVDSHNWTKLSQFTECPYKSSIVLEKLRDSQDVFLKSFFDAPESEGYKTIVECFRLGNHYDREEALNVLYHSFVKVKGECPLENTSFFRMLNQMFEVSASDVMRHVWVTDLLNPTKSTADMFENREYFRFCMKLSQYPDPKFSKEALARVNHYLVRGAFLRAYRQLEQEQVLDSDPFLSDFTSLVRHRFPDKFSFLDKLITLKPNGFIRGFTHLELDLPTWFAFLASQKPTVSQCNAIKKLVSVQFLARVYSAQFPILKSIYDTPPKQRATFLKKNPWLFEMICSHLDRLHPDTCLVALKLLFQLVDHQTFYTQFSSNETHVARLKETILTRDGDVQAWALRLMASLAEHPKFKQQLATDGVFKKQLEQVSQGACINNDLIQVIIKRFQE